MDNIKLQSARWYYILMMEKKMGEIAMLSEDLADNPATKGVSRKMRGILGLPMIERASAHCPDDEDGTDE